MMRCTLETCYPRPRFPRANVDRLSSNPVVTRIVIYSYVLTNFTYSHGSCLSISSRRSEQNHATGWLFVSSLHHKIVLYTPASECGGGFNMCNLFLRNIISKEYRSIESDIYKYMHKTL